MTGYNKDINRSKSPETHVMDPLDLTDPQRIKCASGVELFTLGGIDEEVVQLTISFHAGRVDVKRGLTARLALEMLFEGAAGMTGSEVMERLDNLGAYVDYSMGQDSGKIVVHSMVDQLPEVLSVLKGVLLNPEFEEKQFDRLKGNLKQKFQVDSEKVAVVAKRKFRELVFEGHPYSRVTQLEDYNKVTLLECKEFYNEVLSKNPVSLYLTGCVTKGLTDHVKTFGKEVFNPSEEFSKIAQFDGGFTPEIVRINKEGAVQCGVRIGTPSLGRDHEDFIDLMFVLTILGGYFGSRLMMNIREDKGYTYGIGSGVNNLQRGSYLFIATEVGLEFVDDTLSQIDFEINRLKQEKIPEGELILVKNYINGMVARSLDGPFATMERFIHVHQLGLHLGYYDEVIKRLHDLSQDRVMEIAKTYLKRDEMVTVLVGDFGKEAT